MSKNPSPRADHLRAMREARFTATAARSGGKVEAVPEKIMKQPPATAEPAKASKAKQKIPSRPMGKAKKPKA